MGAWNSHQAHTGENQGQSGTIGDNWGQLGDSWGQMGTVDGSVRVPVGELPLQGMLLQELETSQEMLHQHGHHQRQPERPGTVGGTPGMTQRAGNVPKQWG